MSKELTEESYQNLASRVVAGYRKIRGIERQIGELDLERKALQLEINRTRKDLVTLVDADSPMRVWLVDGSAVVVEYRYDSAAGLLSVVDVEGAKIH